MKSILDKSVINTDNMATDQVKFFVEVSGESVQFLCKKNTTLYAVFEATCDKYNLIKSEYYLTYDTALVEPPRYVSDLAKQTRLRVKRRLTK